MALRTEFVRKQLKRIMPLFGKSSIETERLGQDQIGNIMATVYSRQLRSDRMKLKDRIECAWFYPEDELREGVVCYLHGGGYCCGNIKYASGFASMLASKCGVRVFTAAYALAPEFPFPNAVDDAVEAYQYLLRSGYSPSSIVLCGESAGGGLIYALCLKLRELSLPLPSGLIAISPWSDLTDEKNSYELNRKADITLSAEQLRIFAESYAGEHDLREPLISPLYGDLEGFPPSLIFVGGGEILLDDSVKLHEKLLQSGCQSELIVAPDLWHAYVLYDLKERKDDFTSINNFLTRTLPRARKLRWMKLDNSAKIYPASKRRNWNNTFRLSITLDDEIDVGILQSALDVTARRFPSIAVRVRRGFFWYYLEELRRAPKVEQDGPWPLRHMPFDNIRECAFRVLYYDKRIAVEFFHALTDGNGGLVFLKTLAAEYIYQKYGNDVPPENGVLDRLQEPRAEELEDSFLRFCGSVRKSRSEPTAYHLDGIPEIGGFIHATIFKIRSEELIDVARSRHITVTALICSVLMKAICDIQQRHEPVRKRQKPVRVLIPVDLRRVLGSETLRNFVLYITPGIDPRLDDWTFDEICKSINHQIGLDLTKREMISRITPNVLDERKLVLRLMPLFIKNIAMRLVYMAVGERKSCLSLSNLGVVQIPDEMRKHTSRFDFLIRNMSTTHYNCAMLSYGDMTHIGFTRNSRVAELENSFYQVLKSLGIHVCLESNER